MVDRDRTTKIKVRDELGSLLMFRRTVAPWFRRIARLDSNRVVFDFTDVEFMSRSFADEYLAAKKASVKRIEELNVPEEVRRMLQLVSRQPTARSARAGWTTLVPPPSSPLVH